MEKTLTGFGQKIFFLHQASAVVSSYRGAFSVTKKEKRYGRIKGFGESECGHWLDACGAALVFSCRPDLRWLKRSLTRYKNAGNIVMKNLMDSASVPIYWFIGFGIMFGGRKLDWRAGSVRHEEHELYDDDFSDGFPCATSATIVSGAANWKRTNFRLTIYSALINPTYIRFPDAGYGAADGWHSWDFMILRGSTAVHMVGGVAAFVGAAILGPRIMEGS